MQAFPITGKSVTSDRRSSVGLVGVRRAFQRRSISGKPICVAGMLVRNGVRGLFHPQGGSLPLTSEFSLPAPLPPPPFCNG